MSALWKLGLGDRTAWARGPVDEGPLELVGGNLDDFLATPEGLRGAVEGEGSGPVPEGVSVLAPIESQEVWAAGVTYLRSREARVEESEIPDPYDRVYIAERPELFFKATAWRVRSSGDPIGIRADSTWDVPEPELGVVADARGQVVAYVIGNDVSSRSIEAENPLYLSQAKVYQGSCALGPCLVPVEEAPPLVEMVVSLRIQRGGVTVVDDSVGAGKLKRSPAELVEWLFRAVNFPAGVVLLTGTGVVPEAEFTLQPGDEVGVRITGLGELRNPVERVGRVGLGEG